MAGSAVARWPGALVLAAVLAAGMPAGLAQPGPGSLLGGPAEGDIHLKDGAGRWMLVQGIPVEHAGIDGRSPRVAVIDSGVAADHPQLAGLVSMAKDFTGEGPEDRIGHGTVIAILLRAAGASMGVVAPSPEILSAKVAGADGTIRKQAVIVAIRWAASQKVRLVNLSLGFPTGSDNFADLCRTIRSYKTILFLAAAGNSGPAVKSYPASCRSANLIAVGIDDPASGRGDITAPGTIQLVPPVDGVP